MTSSLSTVIAKLRLEGTSRGDLIQLLTHCRADFKDGLCCSGPSPVKFQVSKVSLGSLFQCLISLTLKNIFYISSWNLPCCNLRLLPLV